MNISVYLKTLKDMINRLSFSSFVFCFMNMFFYIPMYTISIFCFGCFPADSFPDILFKGFNRYKWHVHTFSIRWFAFFFNCKREKRNNYNNKIQVVDYETCNTRGIFSRVMCTRMIQTLFITLFVSGRKCWHVPVYFWFNSFPTIIKHATAVYGGANLVL